MATKKKKKSGGYKKSFRQRKMEKVNPWVILGLYFLLFFIIAYPAVYVVFDLIMKQPLSSGERLMTSIALGIAGAAYYGVTLKAQREGREPIRK